MSRRSTRKEAAAAVKMARSDVPNHNCLLLLLLTRPARRLTACTVARSVNIMRQKLQLATQPSKQQSLATLTFASIVAPLASCCCSNQKKNTMSKSVLMYIILRCGCVGCPSIACFDSSSTLHRCRSSCTCLPAFA